MLFVTTINIYYFGSISQILTRRVCGHSASANQGAAIVEPSGFGPRSIAGRETCNWTGTFLLNHLNLNVNYFFVPQDVDLPGRALRVHRRLVGTVVGTRSAGSPEGGLSGYRYCVRGHVCVHQEFRVALGRLQLATAL